MNKLMIVSLLLALTGVPASAQFRPLENTSVVLESRIDTSSLAASGADIGDVGVWFTHELTSINVGLSSSGVAVYEARGCRGDYEACQPQREQELRQYARGFVATAYIVVVMTSDGFLVTSPTSTDPGFAQLVINQLRGGCSARTEVYGIGYGFIPPILSPRDLPRPGQFARDLHKLARAFSPGQFIRDLRGADDDKDKKRHEEPRRDRRR